MSPFSNKLLDCIDDYYVHRIKAVCVDSSLGEPCEIYDVMEKDNDIYLKIYVSGGSCWHRLTSKHLVQIKRLK